MPSDLVKFCFNLNEDLGNGLWLIWSNIAFNPLGYGDDYEGDAVNLMKYFTASAYSGFEEGEKVQLKHSKTYGNGDH